MHSALCRPTQDLDVDKSTRARLTCCVRLKIGSFIWLSRELSAALESRIETTSVAQHTIEGLYATIWPARAVNNKACCVAVTG